MFGIQPLFWMVYIIAPIIVLLVFALLKPKLLLLSVPICIVLDFICFMRDFLSYEGRGIMLLFTAIQLAIVVLMAAFIKKRSHK